MNAPDNFDAKPAAPEDQHKLIGLRLNRRLGDGPPDADARRALTEMARYRTRAPKGVFAYPDHDAMEADRFKWQVEAIVDVVTRAKA
ncbi:MAG: hypothetical protein KF778_06285 [Rhodocyclaceae bacterium]|nr:hypothetical protein [Rhodocyclaceae bacterium]MBX3667995.1 hypothetical protein [Rhodocyclaceae bacterium]